MQSAQLLTGQHMAAKASQLCFWQLAETERGLESRTNFLVVKFTGDGGGQKRYGGMP